MPVNISVQTRLKRQVVDITTLVEQCVPAAANGVIFVTVLHTTAAITTADLDPGTDQDFLDFLELITPRAKWRHPHDPAHAPDHFLASLIGPSVTIPVHAGKLLLGFWQRVVLIELNGPHTRRVRVAPVTS